MSKTHEPTISPRRWHQAEQTIARLKQRIANMESSKQAARTRNEPTTVIFKTPKFIKEHAQQVARASGLSLSDVLNISLRRFIDEESIESYPTYEMSPELEADLAEIEDDIKHGRNVVATIHTKEDLDDFFAALDRGDYAD